MLSCRCNTTRIIQMLKSLCGFSRAYVYYQTYFDRDGDHNTITSVIRDSSYNSDKPPRGIIALDIDDTLLDWKKSVTTGKTMIKTKERWQYWLDVASKLNLKIIVVTARTFGGEPYLDPHLRVNCVIDELTRGQNFSISAIYYTDVKRRMKANKSYALNLACYALFSEPSSQQTDICLVDDNAQYRSEVVSSGFSASNGLIPDDLQGFIERMKIPRQRALLESKAMTSNMILSESDRDDNRENLRFRRYS